MSEDEVMAGEAELMAGVVAVEDMRLSRSLLGEEGEDKAEAGGAIGEVRSSSSSSFPPTCLSWGPFLGVANALSA